MLEAGQRIVYPMHGAGHIERIEDADTGEYYIINIPAGNVRIRILKDNAGKAGIRLPMERSDIERIISAAGRKKKTTSDNWGLRYRENILRLKTGRLEETAEVIKLLTEQRKEKRLSAAETRLFSLAMQVIISEIVYVFEINNEKAEELLANWIKN